MYVSTQTNENIENVKKTIADINDQLKKKKSKLKPTMDNSQ